MKNEAVERMKAYGILKEAVNDFRKTGQVWVSENVMTPFGRMPALYMLHGYSFEENATKAIQKVISHGSLPYHVIRNRTSIGVMYSVLFVEADKSEWEMDMEDRKTGCQLAYVFNANAEEFSEYGSIGVKPLVGGLLRME